MNMENNSGHNRASAGGNPLLAEGFRNVDQQTRDEQQRCVQCLKFIKSHPGFLSVRDQAFERLELGAPNLTVYDVGCGAGFDTLEIARRLGTGGRVVGVDLSEALINEARLRVAQEGPELPATFQTGDARTLTAEGKVARGSADRVYMERALQHIPRDGFGAVLGEYYAALKPGGIFVSVEPNWELFTVRSGDVAMTRKLHHHWVDRFNHGNVAMNIPPGMRQAGFTGIDTRLVPVVFTKFSDAELVYDFSRTVNELVSKGIVSEHEGSEWLVAQRAAGDDFYCCLMMAITAGRKD